MPSQPLSPDADVRKFPNDLPHWMQNGVTEIVTTRLTDPVPQDTLRRWIKERDIWLRAKECADTSAVERLPDTVGHEYHTPFTLKFHEHLDSGWGKRWLLLPDAAAIIGATSRHFDCERYVLT